MAIWGYSRVSTAAQSEEGESLGVQKRQIEGYALQHDMTISGFFVEEGVSGSVPLSERPAGAKLLATLKPDDIVIAAKLDRVFRSALDALQMVEELRRRRVALHLLDLGGDVSGNGLSKLFLTVAAAFAEAERDRIRERVAQTKRDQAARGRYLGGIVPFGYTVGPDGSLVGHDRQQTVITQVKQMRLGGLSLRAIRAELQKDGVNLSLDAISRIAR